MYPTPHSRDEPSPDAQPSASPSRGDAGHGAFWTYWMGQTISTFGSSITTVVLPLLIFQLTRSALSLSFTVAASVLPYLLFGLLVGAWVDRVNRWRVMIFSDLGRTLTIASLPLAAATGLLSVWWIYAVTFLASTLTICFDAANFATVPSLVRAEALVRANGRIQASYATARVAGPLFAGVLLAVLTLPQLLWMDAASFLVSVGSLLLVGVTFNTARQGMSPARMNAEQAASTPTAPPSIWQDIGEGLGYVLGHPVLRAITVLLLLLNFLLPTVSAQLVLFASEVLGASASQIGFLYASASGGAVLAALVAPRIGKRLPLGQLALAGVGVEGLAILVAAQLHVYGIVLLLWVVRGGADVLFTISSYSLVQRLVPSQLLGRTITVLRVLSWPTASLGAVLGGLAITQTANPVLVYSIVGAGAGSIALLYWRTPVGQGERSTPAPPRPLTSSTSV